MEALLRFRREDEVADAPAARLARSTQSVADASASGSTGGDVTAGSTTEASKTGLAKVEDMVMDQIHKCKFSCWNFHKPN